MNIAVAQSGGPTCAINASLAGVIKEGGLCGEIEKIYGAKNGIDGVIYDRFCDLSALLPDEHSLRLLRETPSTALGSCRIKLPPSALDSDLYGSIFANLERRGVGAFFYIGGNDSMDTVDKLNDYAVERGCGIKFVGIPKTIDNDIPETDHTPGFGSAAKYLATTVKEIIADTHVYNIRSVTIIEIMGRDTGWLAASTSVLRDGCGGAPHLIYLPETPFNTDRFIGDIAELHKEKKAVIVAVSEGLKNESGEYAAAATHSGKRDVFGHKYLGGLGKFLENQVSARLGCKVRAVELNVCQRCAAHVASVTDLNEAEEVGAAAVRAAVQDGRSGVMTTIKRVCDSPYKVEYGFADIKQCANRVKRFPTEWINADGNGVLEEANEYFTPLIQGEVYVRYEGGIPVHFCIDDGEFGAFS